MQNSTLLIAAGSETTATLLTATTYLLLKNPDCLEKVVHEVRTTFSDASEITLLSASRLTYMLACLDESLRVFPVVPSWLPRRVTKGSAIIDGHPVPEGVSDHAKSFHGILSAPNDRIMLTVSISVDPCSDVAVGYVPQRAQLRQTIGVSP